MAKYIVEYLNFFSWRKHSTFFSYQTAARTAQRRATSTGRRHRVVDESGHLQDLFDP